MQIKGKKDGVLIRLDAGSWVEQRDVLLEHIVSQERFFKGGRIALDVGETVWMAVDLGTLIDDLARKEIVLWAILSDSEITKETAGYYGLATHIKNGKTNLVAEMLASNIQGEPSLFFDHSIEAGERIDVKGTVIVMGDVHAEAVINTSCSVFVWGRLNGDVYAGVDGDENAVVCALELYPGQLQIASIDAKLPKRKRRLRAVMARIENGKVITATWHPKSRSIL